MIGIVTRRAITGIASRLKEQRRALLRDSDALEAIRVELDIYDDACANAIWHVDDALRSLAELRVVHANRRRRRIRSTHEGRR